MGKSKKVRKLWKTLIFIFDTKLLENKKFNYFNMLEIVKNFKYFKKNLTEIVENLLKTLWITKYNYRKI